ncbi:hypothetical protein GCM10009665_74360 [Kitasatospora nipponensis]|uniref:Acyltransferase 3 domain-containing protein n=1 Tax=Kitasatospora nipponensis TaxID=258049 RepID=A0ABN1T786_9ACTN
MPTHQPASPPAASPPAPPPPSSRLPSLTGLRFLAAALVFVYHSSVSGAFTDVGLQQDFATAAGSAGFVGVSFFFVLSGFVLTWSARPGDGVRGFWRRRLVKVYPNHLVTFLAALALLAWNGGSTGLREGAANLLLLHAWVPRYSYMSSVNAVSWSLSVEALFYLGFPLLYRAVAAIRPRLLWWAAGAAALAVPLVVLLAQGLLADQPRWPWGPASFTQIWFVYLFPLARLPEFVLGMLLARIVATGRWIPLGRWPAALLVAGGYLLSLHAPFLYRFEACTVVPLGLLIAAAAHADAQRRPGVLGGRVMVRLGELSFAFYLVHGLVLEYGHRAFGRPASPFGYGPAWRTPVAVAFLAGALGVAVLLAWVLHTVVERPAMRHLAGPRPPAARSTVPSTPVDRAGGEAPEEGQRLLG